MKSGVLGKCCLVLSVMLVTGCRTDVDRCRTLCEYLDECEAFDADCTDYEAQNCSEDVDDLEESCRETFNALTDCLDENDNDCDQVRKHCKDEVDKLRANCDGLL